jgi:hypothetical protein
MDRLYCRSLKKIGIDLLFSISKMNFYVVIKINSILNYMRI